MFSRWTSGRCPACGSTVAAQRPTCATCGLDLVADELAKIDYTTGFLAWSRRSALLDDHVHARLLRALDEARGALTDAERASRADLPEPAWPVPVAPPAVAAAGTPPPLGAGLRRMWRPVASDLGVHGLAYLGVLLMFAGTLGLALFSLRSVNAGLRPLAELALPVVLLVSARFLARRDAPLVAASLELLGGAVLPVLAFASLLDGASVPPDIAAGPLLVAVLSAIAAGAAGAYALVARGRPTTTLRYLVGPLAWTAVGVPGLAFHRGPSAAQMALVSVAVTATLLAARGWPRHRLSRPAEVAAVPGAVLAMALVLAFAAAEGWPPWPALAATAATLATIDLLAGCFPFAGGALPAQSLMLGVGLAAVAPRAGWGISGAALLAGEVLLIEWHARRRPDPRAALAGLAVAAVGLAFAMAEPWTAATAAAVAVAWANTRRIRPLAGPFGGDRAWAAGLALAACSAPLALASGLERALPAGPAWVVLAGLTLAAAVAVRRWRPDERLDAWLVAEVALLAALGTAGEWLLAPPPGPAGWLAVAAGLAGSALALIPRHVALRAWSAAAPLAWSLALGLEATGVPPTVRPLAWAAAGLLLVGCASAWRTRIAGHLAAIGHLVGLGALTATGFPASGWVATAALGAWVAAWLLATVAAELGVAPLVDLLARLAGERTWLARAARAVPALLLVAGLPPLVLLAAGLAGLLDGPAARQRSGLALALLALVEALLAGCLASRRPLAVVLAGAGVVGSVAGAALVGPGWLALALAATAAGTAVAAARSSGPLRGGLQVSSVVAGGWAWLELLGWASWPSGLAIGLTAMVAGALACGVAVAVRAALVADDWVPPVGLLAGAAIAGVLVAGGAPGAVVGVPSGAPGLGVAGGIALLAAAAGLAAAPLGLAALRPATGLLAFGAVQATLAAGRLAPARWALATMALAVAATASCLAWWGSQARGSARTAHPVERPWVTSWLATLVPLAGAAGGGGLVAAAVDGRQAPLAAALLVLGLEAAAGSLVLGRPGLARLAPPLACGAWLELTAEAIGGDPQWLTVPVGLTLLAVVELTRAQRRRAGTPLDQQLRLLDHAGMLLVVGAALVQTVTSATSYGLVAGLLGIGLCGWGAVTRVRRRVVVGSATLLLALFGMIAVPVAQLVPQFHGAALWIALTVVGLVLVAVAVSLEQGRARLASAVGRLDRLLEGWE
jgi:hypothetical protein